MEYLDLKWLQYIGLILIFKEKSSNKYTYKYILIIEWIFIFPLINIFRVNSFEDILKLNISFPNPTLDFVKGDFDSYSMLARSIIYVNQGWITWGNQLLGNILFFIPQSWWGSEAVGSSEVIVESMNWSFTNVSCPFIGEGYMNFG